jgi:FeS assembly SUF system protein
MGLFSFLTGKGSAVSDVPGQATESPDRQEDQQNAATSMAGEAEDAAVLSPEPAHEATGGVPASSAETPFVAPDAWGSHGLNVGALTTPAGSATDQPQVGAADPKLTAELQGPIIEVIKTVFDPEIPVDVYELGLIYDIVVDADRKVLVRMTLTSPACPSAQQLPSEVRYKVKAIEGIADAAVEIVWEPPWDKDRMSEAAKLQLGFF